MPQYAQGGIIKGSTGPSDSVWARHDPGCYIPAHVITRLGSGLLKRINDAEPPKES